MLITLTENCVIYLVVFHLCLIYSVNSAGLNLTATVPCERSNLIKPASYDEFVFEHQVTKQEAIEALNLINDTFFNAPKPPGCKAIQCTNKVMKYCLGSQFLNDHCWCEQGHGKEGLPWVPHTCYVGDKTYASSVGSCFFYQDVKECCCDRALAQRWKFLSASIKHEGNILNILATLGCLHLLKMLNLQSFGNLK